MNCFVKRVIIAGLGNPGAEMQNTRHNLGMLLLTQTLKRYVSSKLATSNSRLYASCTTTIQNVVVALVKPLTYMNDSGRAIKAALLKYDVHPSRLLVIHDDLMVKIGSYKMKFGGSEAGHNGLRSISSNIGTRNYWRLRIGIGRPKGTEVHHYVLSSMSKEEVSIIQDVLDDILSNIEPTINRIMDTQSDGLKP